MQLQNMQKFSANEDTTKMAWHSYWMLLKHVGEAASEGPGVLKILTFVVGVRNKIDWLL